MARVHVLCLTVCLLAASAAAAPWVSGIATFTGEENAKSAPNGACGYGTLTQQQYPGLSLAGVSLSKSILGKYELKGCGSCLEVRCTDKEACSTSKPVTVMVHDNCDECETNHINLQAAPFAKLASPDLGRIKIEYREVPCAFEGGVIAHVDSYRSSGGGWVRMSFKNVNGAPLEKVEIAKAASDSFRPMQRKFGAAFEASRLPALPWDIKLTNTAGDSIVLTEAITSEQTGDVKTSKNF